MAKRGSPALYELIRARGSEPRLPATGMVDRPADLPEDEPLPGGWLRPGHMLRIPLGYVFIAVAVAIILASLTYMAGYSRGRDEARHLQDASELLLGGTSTPGPQPHGARPVSNVPVSPESPESPNSPESRDPEPSQPSISGGSRSDELWGPILSDPRQTGLNYLMLITTRRSGAERFINFARERGLETYMIRANNELFRVFALPGFDDHTSDAAAAFREEALRIGRMYQEQYRESQNPVAMSQWNKYVARQE